MSHARWLKSSRSAAASDNCVEVRLGATGMDVRDSKDPNGPIHSFDAQAWRSFLASAKDGALDLP